MDSTIVHQVIKSDYYFLPTPDSIVVRGSELINQVVSQRLPRDTFINIISSAQYKLTAEDTTYIRSGQALVDLVPQGEYASIMGIGAFFLGVVLGWNLYFINRYRNRATIGLADLTSIISALAGVVILSFFDNSLRLIGNYGLGLGLGFILYFLILVVFSLMSKDPKNKFPDFFLTPQEGHTPFFYKKCEEENQ